MNKTAQNLTLASLAALLAACSGDDGDGGNQDTGPALTTYVSHTNNGVGRLRRGNKEFDSDFSILARAQQGLALDYHGTVYQASDAADLDGVIRILGRARTRSFDNTDEAVFDSSQDRDIGFTPDPFNPLLMNETTLVSPRGVAIAQERGFLIVADFGDPAIRVWGTAADGNVPPFQITTLAVAPWDVAYDGAADRLFVSLVDGTVAVFDDYIAAQPAGATRTIIPANFDATEQVSTSLRGIHYRASVDELTLSDVGVEGPDEDGRIYVIGSASTADGLTPQQGLFSDLGLKDPVDVVVTAGRRLRVADVGSNTVSIFNWNSDIPGDPNALSIAPGYEEDAAVTVSIPSPNGLALEPLNPTFQPGESAIDDPATALAGLVVTTRPATGNGLLHRLDAELVGPASATFDVEQAVAGVTLDVSGDAFVAYAGGVAVVNRFGKQRGTGADLSFNASRDRLLRSMGGPFDPPNPLVDPRSLVIDDASGLVIVSDTGMPGLWFFGRDAGGTSTAFRQVTQGFTAGAFEPHGVDYDAQRDTLYVATSAGSVFVYENVLSNPSDFPDRTITPSDALGATQISVDLRGLTFDSERDLLILGDVGAGAADGRIFVIESASTAAGLAAPVATLSGASTLLDDPADFAWNGSTLWVAEAAGGLLLRFDELTTLDGNVAPTASLAFPDVFSVALNVEAFSPSSGGSILAD